MDAQTVFQGVAALALLLTATASLIGALISFGNRKRAEVIRERVEQISLKVDGRFSASQEQVGNLLQHILTLDPAVAAKAAAQVLETAAALASKGKQSPAHAEDQPIDVRVVTDDKPVPVQVVPPEKK